MNKYCVSRNIMTFEYADVEAESEEEAIEIAKELDEDEWYNNPNDEYLHEWSYNAELDGEDV